MRTLADSAAEADASGGDEAVDAVSADPDPGIDQGALPLVARPQGRAPGCTEALARRLAAHRTMALQAMLARNPTVARKLGGRCCRLDRSLSILVPHLAV